MNVKCNRLISTAVPTLFDVPNPPPKFGLTRRTFIKRVKQTVPLQQPTPSMPSHSVVAEQTKPEGTWSSSKDDAIHRTPTKRENTPMPYTPRKRLMASKIKQLHTHLWRKQKAMSKLRIGISKGRGHIDLIAKAISQYLPRHSVAFIRTQLSLAKKSPQGVRWQPKDKMFALSIYYHSRRAYSILKRFFKLPSESTLQKLLQRTNIRPGFNEKVLDAMERKVKDMDIEDKQCVLIFDEIALKKGTLKSENTTP